MQGTVKSGWALSETGLEVKVFIPANCTAELRLPAALFVRPSLLLDGQLLLRNGAVSIDGTPLHSLRVKDGCISIHIGSGSYSFSLRAE